MAQEVGVSKHKIYAWKAKYYRMDVSLRKCLRLRDEDVMNKIQYPDTRSAGYDTAGIRLYRPADLRRQKKDAMYVMSLGSNVPSVLDGPNVATRDARSTQLDKPNGINIGV